MPKDAGPLVVIEDDDAAGHHAVKQTLQRSQFAGRVVQVDMQVGDGLRNAAGKRIRQQALDQPYLGVGGESLADDFEKPFLLAGKLVPGDRMVIIGIVAPECFRKCRAAQIVGYGLDAGAGINAALDKVPRQMQAMEGGAGKDVTSPHDRFVSVILDIALPCLAESRVLQHRVVARPGKQVVAEKESWLSQACCLFHHCRKTLGITDTPVSVR